MKKILTELIQQAIDSISDIEENTNQSFIGIKSLEINKPLVDFLKSTSEFK